MAGIDIAFGDFLTFILTWLPSGLATPVIGVFAAAFLIVLIKIVLAIVDILTKVLDLFVLG